MLLAGRSSLPGSQDNRGMASLGSLNLPSSMDIALYLEQVQEVEPALMSPHGCASALVHTLLALTT